MPIIRVTTTAPSVPEGFEARLVELMVKLLPHKPKSHVFIMVSPNTNVYNPTLNPDGKGEILLIEIQSMDAFTPENVESLRRSFVEFLHNETKIPDDRSVGIIYWKKSKDSRNELSIPEKTLIERDTCDKPFDN